MGWFGPNGDCGCCGYPICGYRFVVELSGFPDVGDFDVYEADDDLCNPSFTLADPQPGIAELNGTYSLDLTDPAYDGTDKESLCGPGTCGIEFEFPVTLVNDGGDTVYPTIGLCSYPDGTFFLSFEIYADNTPPKNLYVDWTVPPNIPVGGSASQTLTLPWGLDGGTTPVADISCVGNVRNFPTNHTYEATAVYRLELA